MSDLIRWVDDASLTDEPAMQNLNLPAGVTVGDLCDAATDYLWRASGARYDAHEVTIRPSRLGPDCGCLPNLISPGVELTFPDCACLGPSEISLVGPASDISVTVDGVDLADSAWLLLDGYRLVRVGGWWPCCQSPAWSVTYTQGIDPPPIGRLAARELVIELALYHSGKESKLPKGTTSVVRSGVSIQMQQPRRRSTGEASSSGTTGLPTVELFLDAVNPNRQRQAPLVLSPDSLAGGRIS